MKFCDAIEAGEPRAMHLPSHHFSCPCRQSLPPIVAGKHEAMRLIIATIVAVACLDLLHRLFRFIVVVSRFEAMSMLMSDFLFIFYCGSLCGRKSGCGRHVAACGKF